MVALAGFPDDLTTFAPRFPLQKIRAAILNSYAEHDEVDDGPMAQDGTDVEIDDKDLKNALMFVPDADDYDNWLKVGFALHYHYDGAQEGLDLWHEWSETADNYEPEVLNSKWPSLSVTGKNNKPITARYILKIANQVSKNLNQVQRPKLRREGGDIAMLERTSEIRPVSVSWLWPYWIPIGKLILLAGSPGTGKTTLTLLFAAIISRGGKWPDGTSATQGEVVIWSSEDDLADTILPRLLANGGNLKNIRSLSGVKDKNNKYRPFDPATDIEALMKALKTLPNVKLIIIDPIVSAISGDSHKNAEVRRGLQPIVEIAAEIGAAIIGITHFTKGTGGKDTTERVTGSLAFAALARIVLATTRDGLNGGYLLTRSKSNLGPDGGGYRYDIDQVSIKDYPEISASKIEWGDFIEGSAKELIKAAEAENVKPNHPGFADIWLGELLENGPMLANDIFDYGKADGFSKDVLKRAKEKIGAESRRAIFRGPWWWLLQGQQLPKGDSEL